MTNVEESMRLLDKLDEALTQDAYYGLEYMINQIRDLLRRKIATNNLKEACPRCFSDKTECYGEALDIDMNKRWTGARTIDEWICKKCNMFWYQIREKD